MGVGVQNAVRMEFLTQCLRQLVTARQPTGVVYVLALRWTRTPSHGAQASPNSSTNRYACHQRMFDQSLICLCYLSAPC